MSAIATGHGATMNAASPPSEADVLAAFVEALADPAAAARALYSIGTFDPNRWARESTVPDLLPLLSVRIAPKANQEWQGNHYAIAVLCSDPFRFELHLPSFFASVSELTTFLRSSGRQFLDYMFRAREITFLLCEMLFVGRMQFMLDLKEKFDALPSSLCFRFSPGDGCSEPDVATLSRKFGANNVLMPDGYFYKWDSYARHKERVITDPNFWLDRSNVAVWRGTSTGAPFTSKNLTANDRIRMTAICSERPDLFDAKISHIAQVSDADRAAVEKALSSRGLLGGFVQMDVFRQHKYALHIDGNTSAAGFFEKMALGCCVLRVASRFEQWFEPRVRPWEHFVPIAADMSDLLTTMTMLVGTPELGKKIAENAFAFAAKADFYHEAEVFCRTLSDAAEATRFIKVEKNAPVVLAAPGKTESGKAFWHGLEVDKGVPFRWTKTERVQWTIPEAVAKPGRCDFQLLYHSEIRPGFASACALEIAGRKYPLSVDRHVLSASVVLGEGFDGTVTLVTPPPCSTAELGTGADTRSLGIAVAVA